MVHGDARNEKTAGCRPPHLVTLCSHCLAAAGIAALGTDDRLRMRNGCATAPLSDQLPGTQGIRHEACDSRSGLHGHHPFPHVHLHCTTKGYTVNKNLYEGGDNG